MDKKHEIYSVFEPIICIETYLSLVYTLQYTYIKRRSAKIVDLFIAC